MKQENETAQVRDLDVRAPEVLPTVAMGKNRTARGRKGWSATLLIVLAMFGVLALASCQEPKDPTAEPPRPAPTTDVPAGNPTPPPAATEPAVAPLVEPSPMPSDSSNETPPIEQPTEHAVPSATPYVVPPDHPEPEEIGGAIYSDDDPQTPPEYTTPDALVGGYKVTLLNVSNGACNLTSTAGGPLTSSTTEVASTISGRSGPLSLNYLFNGLSTSETRYCIRLRNGGGTYDMVFGPFTVNSAGTGVEDRMKDYAVP